ncbi:hypothetical protein, partial [Methylomonas koyamae]|uniref:hypothetical protein n=1 Tax=Methylomonas koyamae TaxID=702114 RepID=UPI00210F84DF
QFKSGPAIALGDARGRVEAGSGIEIGSVLNPLALPKKSFLYGSSYFTRYGSGSGIALQTLAGDLVLNNDTKTIAQEYKVLKQDPKIVGKISAETFFGQFRPAAVGALSGRCQRQQSQRRPENQRFDEFVSGRRHQPEFAGLRRPGYRQRSRRAGRRRG